MTPILPERPGAHVRVNPDEACAVDTPAAVVAGLTIVAFGTSAPEVAVSVAAALDGNTNIGPGPGLSRRVGAARDPGPGKAPRANPLQSLRKHDSRHPGPMPTIAR